MFKHNDPSGTSWKSVFKKAKKTQKKIANSKAVKVVSKFVASDRWKFIIACAVIALAGVTVIAIGGLAGGLNGAMAVGAFNGAVVGALTGAAPARAVLEKFGIGINDASNGVFSPTVKNASSAAYHPSLHAKVYYEIVNEMLKEVATKTDTLDTLGKIAEELLKGTF